MSVCIHRRAAWHGGQAGAGAAASAAAAAAAAPAAPPGGPAALPSPRCGPPALHRRQRCAHAWLAALPPPPCADRQDHPHFIAFQLAGCVRKVHMPPACSQQSEISRARRVDLALSTADQRSMNAGMIASNSPMPISMLTALEVIQRRRHLTS